VKNIRGPTNVAAAHLLGGLSDVVFQNKHQFSCLLLASRRAYEASLRR
jgi:hypothetical protein